MLEFSSPCPSQPWTAFPLWLLLPPHWRLLSGRILLGEEETIWLAHSMSLKLDLDCHFAVAPLCMLVSNSYTE